MSFEKFNVDEILGKYILVGITYLDKNGNQKEQRQWHGIIKSASETEGILLELKGSSEGHEWNMPPDTSSFSLAEPGEYKLRSTGEKIENPDYICSWIVDAEE